MTDTPEVVMARALGCCEHDGVLAVENETVVQDQIADLRAAGYAIVPVEPTEKMEDAHAAALNLAVSSKNYEVGSLFKIGYAAAITAAQEDQP